jgi:hypothetical protein
MNAGLTLRAERTEPMRDASAPVVELRGVGLRLVARDAVATLQAGHDLANVIPFTRGRRDGDGGRQAPAVVVMTRAHAALADIGRAKRWAALLLCSMAIHAGIYFSFHGEAPPAASIGLESISVELMLGANMAAGPTPEKGESDASAPTPAMAPDPLPEAPPDSQVAEADTPVEQPKAVEPEQTRTEMAAVDKPVEITPAEAVAAAPTMPVQPVPDQPQMPAPVQAAPGPDASDAELQASINPSKPVEPTETHVYATAAAPKPKVVEPRREIEHRQQREDARREKARQE